MGEAGVCPLSQEFLIVLAATIAIGLGRVLNSQP